VIISGKDATFINLAANYITGDIIGLLKKDSKAQTKENLPSSLSLITLIDMIIRGELSSRGAKDILPHILENKEIDVKTLAESLGLIQKNDPDALKKIVEEVLFESPDQVADYKAGKEQMFMYFVGQCMKKSKGSGNPSIFQELLKDLLAV
jgi:aspartyl-tRNA(Asn)/glutamyl-tRNA(Gln) amidotransferase subunit B